MWDETLAKRGSNEIGSELIKFCEKTQHANLLVMISDDACEGKLETSLLLLSAYILSPKHLTRRS